MRRFPHSLLWLPVLLLVFVSCSHNPRKISGTESSYLLDLRREYLAANPDGEFNEYVSRGEVVKGMDVIAVLAAWGHPEVRKRESPLTEEWVFRDVDEVSKDWLLYTFTFHRSILSDWDVMRHFAAGGEVNVPERRDSPTLTRGDNAASTGSGAPRKN